METEDGHLKGQPAGRHIKDGRRLVAFGPNVLDRSLRQEGDVGVACGELLGGGGPAEPQKQQAEGKEGLHQLLGFPASIQAEKRTIEQLSSLPD